MRSLTKNHSKFFVVIFIGLFVFFTSSSVALAEVKKVRLAKQFGFGFLPFIVMVEKNLIEKHAKAAGLGDIEVTQFTFGSGAVMNDALISGNLDFASGGVTPMIKLWGKTRGILDVKAVAATSAMPLYLNTINPTVKSVKDFTDKDRIAVAAVKVSLPAVILQMGVAKVFGIKNYDKLDHLTVSMKHPDAMVAMLSGKSEITSHLTSTHYMLQELEDPRVHKVFSSYDVLDGPHSFLTIWATSKFRQKNPKTYSAFIAALDDAMDIINKDKHAAAELYVKATKSKLSVETVYKMMMYPFMKFTSVPLNTMKYANFMYHVGSIPVKPTSWKDMFFPEIHEKPGS